MLSPPGIPRTLWSRGGSLASQPGQGLGEVKAEPGVPPAWAELAALDLGGTDVAPRHKDDSPRLFYKPLPSWSQITAALGMCPSVPPQIFGDKPGNPRGRGFLDLYIPEGGTVEISTFKDKSNSTPHPQPLATYTCTQDHLYRCTHTHTHTHTCTHRYVHTSTHMHVRMYTHGHAHTPQKNWKA